ncbi:hypothetical protein [Adhaeribacter aquaticus]|uniref:hypothetical protein n=1 Tax=Adhaeribacter aquaticus TaxID=299567 RepID=UPI0006890E01|nr:hypothetical protein [Adhaeribacter aquaticus]
MKSKRSKLRLLVICLLYINLLAAPVWALAANKSVVILFDQGNKTYAFTAAQMKQSLEKAGYQVQFANVSNLQKSNAQLKIILTEKIKPEAKGFNLPAASAQGYAIRQKDNSNTWYIIGADKRGTMYGGLDVAETIQLQGLAALTNLEKKPYLENRGIKFNIPLDARTPSYTDNGDAGQKNMANMWDINFWHEFLDEMARDRLNVLSLWSESPFPTLVSVPEYPNASLDDVMISTVRPRPDGLGKNMLSPEVLNNLVTLKAIKQADKIKFWQEVMQYAQDRGIDTYLFTWNLFVYGTENSGYGFTDKITDSKTKDYIRKATTALIKTYPLLKGIGLTAGENMSRDAAKDEAFLYETYGLGINDALATDPKRTFTLIHRGHFANVDAIKAVFAGLNPRCELNFSYKYSQAHMHSSVRPDYIHKDKFVEHIGNSRFFLTVRDDDYYMLRGGSDPSFIRAYMQNMPNAGKNLRGFYMGPDGTTWGREYISKDPDAPNQLVLKKRWYFFQLVGKLAYDPTIPDEHFVQVLRQRFPEVDAKKLHSAWAKASQIIPKVSRFHNGGAKGTRTMDFQWYPEAVYPFAQYATINDLNSFIADEPMLNEGLISIPAYAEGILNNKPIAGTTPVQVARQLQELASQALKITESLPSPNDKELRQTIGDIKAMSFLGLHYANKILGATNKHLADKVPAKAEKQKYWEAAIADLKEAAQNWKLYANQISSQYQPFYAARLYQTIDIPALQVEVENDIKLVEKAEVKFQP